jgi:phage gp36-like protein
MEAFLGERVTERVEQLAFYFYRSDETRKALEYLDRAADGAVAVEATGRAEELWARARRLAERLGDDDAVHRYDRQLAWLRKRTTGELPLPPIG